MTRTLRAWLARIAGFVRPKRGERDFADELQCHIDLHVADNIRAGVLLTVALVAAAVPARRILRADPVTTLQCD